MKTLISVNETFAQDVDQGLSSDPKFLSSKYFYDEEGDRIFQKIMEMPEYYLTNAEVEIFSQQTDAIQPSGLNLVEPSFLSVFSPQSLNGYLALLKG